MKKCTKKNLMELNENFVSSELVMEMLKMVCQYSNQQTTKKNNKQTNKRKKNEKEFDEDLGKM